MASRFGDLAKPFIRSVMRSFSDFQSHLTLCAALSISAQIGFQINHGDQFGIGRISASVSSLDISVNASNPTPTTPQPISAQIGCQINHGDQFGIGRISASVSSLDISVNASKATPSD